MLIVDEIDDAVYGFRNGARHSAKDISNAVLTGAGVGSPRGITVDLDGDVLIVDGADDAVYGFRNGARHSAKDISNAVLTGAGVSVSPNRHHRRPGRRRADRE